MSHNRFKLASSGILLAAAIFACSEGATNPTDDRLSFATIGDPGVADTGEFELCKHGTAAKFAVTIDGVSQHRFILTAETCTVLATTAALGRGNHTVTVTEDVLKGTTLDSIVGESFLVTDPGPVRGPPITGTPTITRTFNGDRGWVVHFYNH